MTFGDMMKKHIGILTIIAGVLFIYPLSNILAPWLSRIINSASYPPGNGDALNVTDAYRGFHICSTIAIIMIAVGIFIEIHSYRKRNKTPNHPLLGTSRGRADPKR